MQKRGVTHALIVHPTIPEPHPGHFKYSRAPILDDVEKLAERIFSQPQLLQKREQWKRHGLYFENMHKYKTMPSDIALIPRAKAVAEKLAGLPKFFSDALKGVKLATAVASQIQSWITIAEPLLNKEKKEQ